MYFIEGVAFIIQVNVYTLKKRNILTYQEDGNQVQILPFQIQEKRIDYCFSFAWAKLG